MTHDDKPAGGSDQEQKKNALIITSNDFHFHTDNQRLTSLGVRVLSRLSSGLAAIDYIRYNPVKLVLCDNDLSDITVLELIKRIKGDFILRYIPLLVVSERSDRNFVLDVIAAGCSAFIVRPYSREILEKHLNETFSLLELTEQEEEFLAAADENVAQGNFEKAVSAYQSILERQEEHDAEYFFDLGMKYVIDRRYNKAVIAFNKSLRINQAFIKAYKGLAEAYKGMNDLEKYKYYVQKAADEYARIGNFQEVRELFTEIIKYDENAPNPYNTLGIQLRKKGNYPGAIKAYQKALELDAEDENIFFNMARAHYFQKEWKHTLKSLIEALKINPNHQEAKNLYQVITQKEWIPDEAEQVYRDFTRDARE